MNRLHIKNAIAELRKKHDTVVSELRKLDDAISSMQNICVHEWQYAGHSHNDDHYKCLVCGAEKEE